MVQATKTLSTGLRVTFIVEIKDGEAHVELRTPRKPTETESAEAWKQTDEIMEAAGFDITKATEIHGPRYVGPK